METIIERINKAHDAKEIVDIIYNSALSLSKHEWDAQTRQKIEELQMHSSFWKEGKFLSELSNLNRLEKMINSLNVLEATVSLKKDINDNKNITNEIEVS
jgi:hypothetical protein